MPSRGWEAGAMSEKSISVLAHVIISQIKAPVKHERPLGRSIPYDLENCGSRSQLIICIAASASQHPAWAYLGKLRLRQRLLSMMTHSRIKYLVASYFIGILTHPIALLLKIRSLTRAPKSILEKPTIRILNLQVCILGQFYSDWNTFQIFHVY